MQLKDCLHLLKLSFTENVLIYFLCIVNLWIHGFLRSSLIKRFPDIHEIDLWLYLNIIIHLKYQYASDRKYTNIILKKKILSSKKLVSEN